jgi:predicted ATPase with chaperone activity
MLSKILSATLIGIDAHVVDVEVDITNKGLLLPEENAKEAAVVDGIPVYGFENIPELIEFFRGIPKSTKMN